MWPGSVIVFNITPQYHHQVSHDESSTESEEDVSTLDPFFSALDNITYKGNFFYFMF